jgi:hypothetical protein
VNSVSVSRRDEQEFLSKKKKEKEKETDEQGSYGIIKYSHFCYR